MFPTIITGQDVLSLIILMADFKESCQGLQTNSSKFSTFNMYGLIIVRGCLDGVPETKNGVETNE